MSKDEPHPVPEGGMFASDAAEGAKAPAGMAQIERLRRTIIEWLEPVDRQTAELNAKNVKKNSTPKDRPESPQPGGNTRKTRGFFRETVDFCPASPL
jgi:hypothetical protein